VDANVGIKPTDEALFKYLCELKKPYVVVLTKADKLSGEKLEMTLREVGKAVSIQWAASPLIFATSAKVQYGLSELRAYLAYLLLQTKTDKK
jgi:GTP-binding protein